MQPIHWLVYPGIAAGAAVYLIGLLLLKIAPRPRIFRFMPGLLSLVASIILLYADVYISSGTWDGIAAFALALISTSLIGLVLLAFQLFYRMARHRERP